MAQTIYRSRFQHLCERDLIHIGLRIGLGFSLPSLLLKAFEPTADLANHLYAAGLVLGPAIVPILRCSRIASVSHCLNHGTAMGVGLIAPIMLLSVFLSDDRPIPIRIVEYVLMVFLISLVIGAWSCAAYGMGRLLIRWVLRTRIVPQDGSHCPNCAYNLTANTSMTCPECGESFTFEQLDTTEEAFRRLMDKSARR